jgi:hypothetical protein
VGHRRIGLRLHHHAAEPRGHTRTLHPLIGRARGGRALSAPSSSRA